VQVCKGNITDKASEAYSCCHESPDRLGDFLRDEPHVTTLACAVLGAYASACPICRYTKHERNQHLAFIRFAGIKTKPEKMPELPSYMESVENQVRQCGKHGWFVRWRFMRGLKKAVAQPLQANWLSDTSYYD
jgi:hypothetical protein